MYLTGKGFYAWKLKELLDGDPEAIAEEAVELGLSHVIPKIADGINSYNVSVDLPLIVSTLKARGLAVYGYAYTYAQNTEREAAKVVERYHFSGVDGLIIDVEGEYKRPGAGSIAYQYMAAIREELPEVPIGLASDRWPSYHQEIPWGVFRSFCNFDMPQMYWLKAHNPAYQLAKSLEEFKALSPKLPYYPTGSAFCESGWCSSAPEVYAFMGAAEALGLPAINFWEWSHTKERLPDVYQIIKDYDYPAEPIPEPPGPDPEPPGPIEELDLMEIYELIAKLKEDGLDPVVNVNINYDGAELELEPGTPPPDPEPEPPGPDPEPGTVVVEVTKDPRANARYIRDYNNAGRPIMEIYPSDSSSTSDRVQYNAGTRIDVYPDKVRADGGDSYYKLADWEHDAPETLYLRDGDVKRV